MTKAAPYHGLSVEQERWVGEGRESESGTTTQRLPHEVTIMLVEDEPAVRSVIGRALRREGYQVLDAGDGVEAIEAVDRHLSGPLHLLITDLDMPRLGGMDLAAHLCAADRVQRVIFMTGDIFRPSFSGGLTSVLLRKPLNLRQLIAVVEEMLSC